MRKNTVTMSGNGLGRFRGYCHGCWNSNCYPSFTHRLDPNHERAAFIMQKLLRGEKEQDGSRRMAMQRRAEEDPDVGEEENMVEGMGDILAVPFRDGLDQHESLQQQLYRVS